MRYVDTELSRPRWRATANYRLLPSLQIGIEWNLRAGEVGPLATWYILTEAERHPAVFLGTSSDRIGSPEGTQSYYVTALKGLPRTPVAPYLSLNYSEWDERLNMPFGAHVHLAGPLSLLPMYDGERTHVILNLVTERYGLGLLYVWTERLGVSLSAGF